MRVVLDTNVLVRATKSASGPARELLAFLGSDPHVLLISRHILIELVRVLQYPRVLQMHRLSLADCREFVSSLEQMAEHVELPENLQADRISSDPDDDHVIATALAGRADVLCTLDRHLNRPTVRAHCAAHGLRVLADVDLLALFRELEQPSSN